MWPARVPLIIESWVSLEFHLTQQITLEQEKVNVLNCIVIDLERLFGWVPIFYRSPVLSLWLHHLPNFNLVERPVPVENYQNGCVVAVDMECDLVKVLSFLALEH